MDRTQVLAGLPVGLRDPLLSTYADIVTNFAEGRWEPSELNGGKLCEVVYCIVQGALSGQFASQPAKPTNMVAACKALEQSPADPDRPGDHSLRILIPRVLPALYDVRNNRGVGHVGGDVDPNYMDAVAVYSMSSWLLAELIRIFHQLGTKDAQQVVDTLVERKVPLIWEIGDARRVLDTNLSKSDQTLLLLHGKPGWANVSDLVRWIEYSNESMFKTRILKPLHAHRFIEFDTMSHRAAISPKGVTEVETRILKTRT